MAQTRHQSIFFVFEFISSTNVASSFEIFQAYCLELDKLISIDIGLGHPATTANIKKLYFITVLVFGSN